MAYVTILNSKSLDKLFKWLKKRYYHQHFFNNHDGWIAVSQYK